VPDSGSPPAICLSIGDVDAGLVKLDSHGCALLLQNEAYAPGGSVDAGTLWSCVADKSTQKVWAAIASPTTGLFGWGNVPDAAIAPTNALKLCGFDDWGLPTVSQSGAFGDFTLLAAGWADGGSFIQGYFPVLQSAGTYWSATLDAADAGLAFTFTPNQLQLGVQATSMGQGYALLVRGTNLQPSWGSPHIGSGEPVTLTPVDPEGDAFATTFTGCTVVDAGASTLIASFTLLASDGGTLALDCTQPYLSTSVPLDVAIPLQLTATFPSLTLTPTRAQANATTLHFTFKDGASTLPPNDSTVDVDARYVNTGPVMTIQGLQTSTYTATQSGSVVFTPAYFVQDPDFVLDPTYTMTLNIALDNTNAPDAGLNVSTLQPLMATYDTCLTGQVVTQTLLSLTCGIDSVNELLGKVAVMPPHTGGNVTLTATVNDNGNAGQCPDVPLYTNAPCPLTDTITASISYICPGGGCP
jgi:hypothetical protein